MTINWKKAAALGAVASTLFGGVTLEAAPVQAGQRTGTWKYHPGPYPYRNRSNEGAAAEPAIAPRDNPPTYAYPAYGDPRYMPRRDCYTTQHRVTDPWGATRTHTSTYCD